MVNVQQALNRGFNLLATSIIGISGTAFLPEAFFEKDFPDKIDDALLFIVGIAAVVWYTRSNNRYVRSILPVAFLCIGAAVKLMGLLIEIGDPESAGDDFGGLILFIIGTVLVLWQYVRTGKMLSESSTS